jgi:hypothetical protein
VALVRVRGCWAWALASSLPVAMFAVPGLNVADNAGVGLPIGSQPHRLARRYLVNAHFAARLLLGSMQKRVFAK